MKTAHLHDLWAAPDNSRLTSKQFSFRLPVHVAAKIGALCEMYPQKNRTQIVADLLTSALDALEESLPETCGEEVEPGWQDQMKEDLGISHRETLYYMGGVRARFRSIANRHYLELEAEQSNPDPNPLYSNVVGTKDHFTK